MDVTVEIRYYLRSLRIKVDNPTDKFEDNQSVCIISNDPGSTINNNVALSYHYVMENVENKVVNIINVSTDDNYADPLTKAVNRRIHGGLFHELLCT